MKKKHILLAVILLITATQGARAQITERERSWVTLRSDHTRWTQPGDTITLSGHTNVGNPLSPFTTPLQVRVLHPDGTYAYDDLLYADGQGHYDLQVVVRDSGYLSVTVEWGGNDIYRPSRSEMIIPIREKLGMAIVVAGRGSDSSHFEKIEYLSDRAVKVLRRIGMPDDPDNPDFNRVYYMHPEGVDRELDVGSPITVDAEPTVANLTWAIETWAAGLIPTRDSDGNWSELAVRQAPLTIFLIGDIIEDDNPEDSRFVLSQGELITPLELGALLDGLEASILQQFIDAGVPEPPYVPMNIIVEAPCSGDFIQSLSKRGRVILTSTDIGGNSYLSSGGSVSFLAYFLSRIAGGHYIHPSFAYAQLYVLNDPTLAGQNPQIEATGNGIANEIADEIETASQPLAYRNLWDARPRLQNGLGSITLHNISAARLWVYVDDPEDELAAVNAVIIPPEDSFEETQVVRFTENSDIPNKWEGDYTGFYGKGIYTIVYLAEDEAGNTANPIIKPITVSDTEPPLDVTNLRESHQLDDTVGLRWHHSESCDTQGYLIYVTPPTGDEFLWGDVGNVHEVYINNLDVIENPGTYLFRVTAYDRASLESSGATISADFQPPEIFTPGDLVVEAGPFGWVQVNYTVTAVDDVDSKVFLECTPQSGDRFPLGITTVECSAADTSGNVSYASFSVEVLGPNLVIESLTHFPSEPTSEDVITFIVEVANQGIAAGPSTLSFKVGDEPFGVDFEIPPLAQGESQVVQRQMQLSIPGSYTNIVTVDVYDEVVESDENDNYAQDHYVVLDATPPTISVDAIAAPEDGFLPQQTIASFPASIGSSPIEVSGMVEDNTLVLAVTALVNGVEATVDAGGSWSTNIPIAVGDNTLTVEATDLAGNTSVSSVQVTLNLDLDSDGIRNNVDVQPFVVSLEFSDESLAGSTFGRIEPEDPQSFVSFEVADSSSSEKGVDLFVAEQSETEASVDLCSSGGSYSFGPGTYVLTCNTVTIEVIQGVAKVEYTVGGASVSIVVEDGSAIHLEETTDELGEVQQLVVLVQSGVAVVNDLPVLEGESHNIIPVNIDIKPDSDPNCINNDGHGVIPVAILTTGTFDAATVDPFSVMLDGMGVRVRGRSGNAGSLEDVDGDGDLDLVVQIEDMDGIYQEGDATATVSGETYDGIHIQGTDTICIVP
jgi:hypothetical protein